MPRIRETDICVDVIEYSAQNRIDRGSVTSINRSMHEKDTGEVRKVNSAMSNVAQNYQISRA